MSRSQIGRSISITSTIHSRSLTRGELSSSCISLFTFFFFGPGVRLLSRFLFFSLSLFSPPPPTPALPSLCFPSVCCVVLKTDPSRVSCLLLSHKMLLKSLALLATAGCALAHGDHDHEQTPISGPHKSLWYNTLPGDGGTQVRNNTRRSQRDPKASWGEERSPG